MAKTSRNRNMSPIVAAAQRAYGAAVDLGSHGKAMLQAMRGSADR